MRHMAWGGNLQRWNAQTLAGVPSAKDGKVTVLRDEKAVQTQDNADAHSKAVRLGECLLHSRS